MLVRELGPSAGASRTADRASDLLAEVLKTIDEANKRFRKLCETFAQRVGHQTDLSLGWGIARGTVKKFHEDYVGHNVNKAARLCAIARPRGIAIDRDDFPTLPLALPETYCEQSRRLTGIDRDVRIWVTKEIATQFVMREHLRETPEVHVAGVCIDTNDKRGPKILLAKRNPTRRLFPDLWEGCGGQLARSETFAQGVARHFRLEMALEVRVIPEHHCFYEIREPNEPLIPGIRFLCARVGTNEPKSYNHHEVRWVTEEELRNMRADQFVPGLRDDVLALIGRWRESQTRRPSRSSKKP